MSSEQATDVLFLCSVLFDDLGRRDVEYLQWKSNEHLESALRGETDLDLLVRPSSRRGFESSLAEFGFVRMELPRARAFPGREGFLGFDSSTGRLAHLDVHYELVLGEQLVKNHRLPIEEWLFTDSSELLGVKIPSAAKEAIVFYLRVCLKSTLRQRLTSAIRQTDAIPSGIRREAEWLAERAQLSTLESAVVGSGLPISPEDVEKFWHKSSSGELDWRYLGRSKRRLLRALRRFQRRPTAVAVVSKAWLRIRSSRLAKLGIGIPAKRLHGAAPFIAVVGADGSGKSRLTGDLVDWLGWKLSVRHMYFGQPKDDAIFKLLNKPGSLIRGGSDKSRPLLRRVAAATDALKWIYLGRKRRRMAAIAREAARTGQLVVGERFPLAEFWQMPVPMDGPRLQSEPSRLASLELEQYEQIQRPDLVLVLAADLHTLRRRKTDLQIDEHRSKVEAVGRIRPTRDVHVIDASRPYPEVLLEAKQRIWEAIRATH